MTGTLEPLGGLQSIDVRVFEAMPGICVLVQADAPRYTILAVTEALLRAQPSAVKKEDLIGKGFFEPFPPNPGDPNFTGESNIRNSFAYVLANRVTQPLAAQRYDLPNGKGGFTERYWTATNTPVLDDEENVLYILHTAEEITEKVKAQQREDKIRLIEETHNLFVEAPVGICILKGPDLTIELANGITLNMWNCDKTVLGKSLLEVLPELQGQGYIELFNQVKETGQSYTAYATPTTLIRNGKEEVAYFNFVYQPYYEEGRTKAVGILVFGNEVTDMVLARKKIEESEARFRALLAAAPVAIGLFVGRELIIEMPNQAFIEIVGKGDSIIGKPLAQAMPELANQPFLQILDDVYTSGKIFQTFGTQIDIVQHGIMQKGFYDFSYTPLLDREGKVYAILDIAIDVTQQVQSRRRIEESEHYFRQLTDTVPAMIWITAPNGNCTYLNKHWYDYTGQTIEESVDFGWLDIIHAGDKEKAGTDFMQANTRQTSFNAVYRLRNKNGEYRWVIDNGSPRYNADGVYEGMIGTVVDVHEQRMAEEMLRYRKALLEAHNEASIDGILLVDSKGKILSYNQRFVEIWKMPQEIVDAKDDEAALSFAMTQLVNPEQFIEKVKYLYEHPTETCRDELEYRDGKIIERHGYPVLSEDGTYYAWSWTFRDITKQKENEKNIKESEERFRSLADQSPMIVFIVEPNAAATMSYFNKTWLDYTGQTFEEALGRAWDGIVHPDDVQGVLDIYIPAFENRQSYILPSVRLKRYDGEYRWHMFKGNPRYQPNGDFIGFVGVGFDIHEQKLTDDALKENTEQFTTLANNIQNLAWMADEDGWIFWYNQRWYEYTGTTFEEMQGWGWKKVHHPDHIDRVVAIVDEAWQNDQPYELTFPLRRGDGEYRWFLTRVFPVHNADGEVVRWIGTNTDIEEQKTFAENLEKLVDERTKELQQSNEDLQQFAHVASHDLREPVRKIKIFTSRLQEEMDDVLSSRSKLYIDKVQSAADRMFAMIDGVLKFSSMDALKQISETVDLKQLLKNIEDDLEVIIQQKEAVIRYSDFPEFEGAPVLIYQLFYNLINNSLKFAKAGEPLEVSVSSKTISKQNQRFVQIVVSDNGIGFEQIHAEKIFDTFARLNPKDKYEGTGLGLSLCKKIVERHQGTIEAVGKINRGAIFTIILPFKQNEI